MKQIKRYGELLKITLIDIKIILGEYKAGRFHPAYLEQLLAGRYTLLDKTLTVSKELGNKNKSETIALIILDRGWVPTAGFFALLNRTLCALYFADRMGFVPVVGNWDGCAYEENHKVNNTNIVFEYYFQRASKCTVTEAYHSSNVVVPSNNNMDILLNESHSTWYELSKDYIKEMSRIYKKYIRLNDTVNLRMTQDIRRTIGQKKTLAIHFRGSDYRVNANGHPIALQIEDYFYDIDHAVKHYGFEQIFVATDDKNALDTLSKRYKNIVFYKDTKRTEGNVSVAFLKDQRKDHKYNLGYEVLRDAYSLAFCDGLIAGHSQVAVGARFIRESKGKSYQYCRILKKGINHNTTDWVNIYYKSLNKKQKSKKHK